MVVYPIIYRVLYISGWVSKNNGQVGVSKNMGVSPQIIPLKNRVWNHYKQTIHFGGPPPIFGNIQMDWVVSSF